MPHRPSDELVQHLQALNLMMLLFLVRLKAPQFSLMWNTVEAFFTTKTSDTASLATFAREHHEQRQKQQSLIKTAHPNATIAASRGKHMPSGENSQGPQTADTPSTHHTHCKSLQNTSFVSSSHVMNNGKTQCF